MKINFSGSKLSNIVEIGAKLRRMQKESGQDFLFLNRGINAVCPVDLSQVINQIDFNSPDIQVYPPAQGRIDLREAINSEYFNEKSSPDNIVISAGGISGLDIAFQTPIIDKVYLPEFFWGSYFQMLRIRKIECQNYTSIDELIQNPAKFTNSAVVICDPNNPLGNKHDDSKILDAIRKLDRLNVTVLIDSPYRRVFYDQSDNFYQQLLEFENVIILESFSKSIGLSGQRLGFMHSTNKDFVSEFRTRIYYTTNGVNAFAQVLVRDLLKTEKGKEIVHNFKIETREAIRKNIEYLESRHLLAEEFYKTSKPVGIFVVVNKSEDVLLKSHIGSVSLGYFTLNKKEMASKFARICVSVPREKFVAFFEVF